MLFSDRPEAGRLLGEALRGHTDQGAVVLGLPRGGVPVAFEVARALGTPLDIVVVRKLGVPSQPELGLGAIGEGGVRVTNERVLRAAKVSADELAAIERRERLELERRAARFRAGRPAVPLAGKTVFIVDDGIATGSTARVACQVARARGARRVILAVPVGPPGVRASMQPDADDVVCLTTPADFFAVGQCYRDFSQTSDDEVVELLHRARDEVRIPAGPVHLNGRLVLPDAARGVIVFAHGSGSSRNSPRNRHVAAEFNRRGFGTLLFDLLTPDEESIRANVFDIDLLAGRLLDATRWLADDVAAGDLPVGYFGASTGAAAALWAAAEPGNDVVAVVSRGGRPDLASPRLSAVRAPTLLIVGGRDDVVIELNRTAQAELLCESRLEVVPGATHLFEEPGTLETVARLAGDWFARYLSPVTTPSHGT